MEQCQDCGGITDAATCAQRFEDLLALDHSRQPPWGPLHVVVTAAYFLHHPTDPRTSPSQQSVGMKLIESYLSGGQAALASVTEEARRDNHRSRPTLVSAGADDSRPRGDGRAAVTIHDLAVDGTFPAAGHEHRVRQWAAAIAEAHGPPARE